MSKKTFLKGRALDASGRTISVNLELDPLKIALGDSAARLLAFQADGTPVYIEQTAADDTAASSSGTINDILAGSGITVDQPDLEAGDVTIGVNEAQIDHDALLNFLAAEHVDWAAAAAGTIHTDNYIEGGAGSDTTAIHDNVDGEINAVAAKDPATGADILLIEDSAASFAKKKLTIENLEDILTLDNLAGTLAISKGGTGQTAQTAAFNALDPLTTKGDVISHDGTNSVRVAVGTDGYVLTASAAATPGLAWASPGAGNNRWSTVVKTVDQSLTTDDTLNNDADLLFATAANTNYIARMLIIFGSVSATPDFQFAITHSGTTTAHIIGAWKLDTGATAFTNVQGDETPTGNAILIAAGEINMLWIYYFLRTGVSGGTVNFQWAQNTSDANATIVYAGSYLEYLSEAP